MAAAAAIDLPSTFTYSEARERGLSDRQLRRLRDDGLIEQFARGLYQRSDAGPLDLDLLEIAHRRPDATICLTSALVRHGLSDEIPARIDIALPRSQRPARTTTPVNWHRFSPDTFLVGRTMVPLDERIHIGLYNSERCVIDMFRLRHKQGRDAAYEVLRRWLRRRGSSPADLLQMARAFPHAEPNLRIALEVLL